MKKIFIIAAACAALAGCTKEASVATSSAEEQACEGIVFQKGQSVTLSVDAGDPQTKVTSSVNSDKVTVGFRWEQDDTIKVTVNGESSVFKLTENAGSNRATFEGVMPANGTTFDVQYPVDDPVITSQTYSADQPIPHNKLKFEALDCSLRTPVIELKAANAVLRLNLWGTGKTVSKIVVTNTSSTDTLYINPAVTLPTAEASAKPFFIVVPTGEYKFTAEVFDNGSGSVTPPTNAIQNGVFSVTAGQNTFTTASAKTFTAGQIQNMPAKEVTSPKKVYFSKGNLYYDSSSFKFENTQYSYNTSYLYNHVSRFRWAAKSSSLSEDITSAIRYDPAVALSGNSSDVFFTNDTQTTPRTGFAVEGQTGVWRALSTNEWKYLLNTRIVNGGTGRGKCFLDAKINSDASEVFGLILYPDNYTSQKIEESFTSAEWTLMESAGCVFLPAAGHRNGKMMFFIGKYGKYWSSTHNGNQYDSACMLSFQEAYVGDNANTGRGCSLAVRLVADVQ